MVEGGSAEGGPGVPESVATILTPEGERGSARFLARNFFNRLVFPAGIMIGMIAVGSIAGYLSAAILMDFSPMSHMRDLTDLQIIAATTATGAGAVVGVLVSAYLLDPSTRRS